MQLEKTISLEFQQKLSDLCKGLSAAILIEDEIWVANDETISLERFSDLKKTSGETVFGDHKQFELGHFIDLPEPVPNKEGRVQEIDIEGLDYRDGYIWLVGSHSLKRHKPKDAGFDQLAKVTSESNRYLLARIPLVKEPKENGAFILVKDVTENDGVKRAAQLPCIPSCGSELAGVLKDDKHLGKFLGIPSKDNGFDIEGLAVDENNRIFLGLRGPVLRGYAVILEMQLEINEKKPAEFKMKEINPGSDHPKYRKHFLYLNGLGIRDLYIDGSDLLILAGPTMDLDGPVPVYRWTNGKNSSEENIVSGDSLQKIGDIPFGNGADHAEAMTAFSRQGDVLQSILVVYDSASSKYHPKDSCILKADVFRL